MQILRTPDDAADDLVDYPTSRGYVSVPSGDGQDLTVGSRAFTQLLPTRPDNLMHPDNYEAWMVLATFNKPMLTIFGDTDSVAPDGWRPIVERISGAHAQPHAIHEGGGHFLQEDLPEQYTETLMNWLGAPLGRSLATVGSR